MQAHKTRKNACTSLTVFLKDMKAIAKCYIWIVAWAHWKDWCPIRLYMYNLL